MLFAPPLNEKRRGWLFRTSTGTGLFAAALLALATNLSLYVLCYIAVIPTVTPLELYHRTWKMARDNIHDQDALKQWDQWEHKYDHVIKTDEDAIKYANVMLRSIGDPYTFFLDAPSVQSAVERADGQFIGIGVTFDPRLNEQGQPVVDAKGQALPACDQEGFPIIKQLFRGSPAQKGGIRPGDVVISVDGKDARAMTLKQLVESIEGERGTVVKLKVRANGAVNELALTRSPINIPIVSTSRLANGIGYIRLEAFDMWSTAEQVEQAFAELQDCRAFIFDVRDNPGGFVHSAMQVSALFLDEGTITTYDGRIPGHGYMQNKFSVTRQSWVLETSLFFINGLKLKWPSRPPNMVGDRPVVVLVNGGTASASELFTGCVKDNGRVIVVGERTFGKGVGQLYVPVGNGCRLRVTNFKVIMPNGGWVGNHKINNSIVPDIIVPAGPGLMFLDGSDNQLSVAVSVIMRELAKRAAP